MQGVQLCYSYLTGWMALVQVLVGLLVRHLPVTQVNQVRFLDGELYFFAACAGAEATLIGPLACSALRQTGQMPFSFCRS